MSDNISFLPYLLLPLEVDFICAWPLLIKWISHAEMSSSVNGLTLTFIRTKIQYAFLPFSRVKTLRFLPFLSFLRHKILVLFLREKGQKKVRLDTQSISLREKCPYSELFWSAFSRILTEYGEIRSICPYSVRMRENAN